MGILHGKHKFKTFNQANLHCNINLSSFAKGAHIESNAIS